MKISNVYKLLLVALVIGACDPLTDVNKDIEANKTFVDDLIYTLTDDDYELAGENFGSYSDIDDVKATVPVILGTNFPALVKTSSALVSYKFYNGSSPDLNGTHHMATVSDEDYDALGFIYGSFDNATSDVADWANYKYPDAQDGDHADVLAAISLAEDRLYLHHPQCHRGGVCAGHHGLAGHSAGYHDNYHCSDIGGHRCR